MNILVYGKGVEKKIECIRLSRNFPLLGNSVYILFIFSRWLGVFELTFDIKGSV